MICDNCSHSMWEHEFIDEFMDSLIFGKCEIEGCLCNKYEIINR